MKTEEERIGEIMNELISPTFRPLMSVVGISISLIAGSIGSLIWTDWATALKIGLTGVLGVILTCIIGVVMFVMLKSGIKDVLKDINKAKPVKSLFQERNPDLMKRK